MCPPPWIANNVPTLLRPAMLLSMAVYHFIMTILETTFLQLKPWTLLDLSSLRLKSFARLWKHNGEALSAEMPPPLNPLLERCSGLILDIGPGSGDILPRFSPTSISAMYGAEPASELHPGLLANAKKAGFGAKYHALLCGAEPESLIPALHKSGILGASGTGGTAENGVFDEICCIRVFCGVPRPEETIRGLYRLLKPGGRMVVCEHVVNQWRTEGSMIARGFQLLYSLLGWSFFMGGCELQRNTERFVREAGEWESVRLENVGAKDAIPYLVGELIKKGR